MNERNSNLVSFEDFRVKQQLDEEGLTPYSKEGGYIFKYQFTDVEISALNFIRSYLGYEETDDLERISGSLFLAIEFSKHLFNHNLFIPRNNFRWYVGQKVTPSLNLEFKYHETELFDRIANRFTNQGMSERRILTLMVANYIENFHNFFNNLDWAHIDFTTKLISTMKAKERGDKKLVEILEDSNPNPLIFLGIGDQTLSGYNVSRISN